MIQQLACLTDYYLFVSMKKNILFSKYLFILILFSHFFIISWYLLPENPLNHQYKYYINKYISPFFAQSWNLFSPNPISTDQFIAVRFIEHFNGRVITSPYLDLYQPIVNERKMSFFNPNQRILKYFSGCGIDLLETHSKALDIIKEIDSFKIDTVNAKKMVLAIYEKSTGYRSINDYSKYVYGNYKKKSKSIIKVDSVFLQCRIILRSFPRFSKRMQNPKDDKNCKFTHLEFPVYKFL